MTNDASAAPTVRDDSTWHRYVIDVDGGEHAFAQYRVTGDVITFTHTFVPEAARGRGLAGRLVSFALDDARSRGLKVVPECGTFITYMRRHPETLDLVTDDGLRLIEDAT